jgi:transcriptional antiterminator
VNLSWIKEIENAELVIKEVISDNENLLIFFLTLLRKNGVDAFISLYEEFNKNDVTFTYKYINELKRRYVLQYYYIPVKKLASKLDLSERTVYNWLEGSKISNKGNE